MVAGRARAAARAQLHAAVSHRGGRPGGLTVAPDQRNVYAVAAASNAIVAFARGEDGRLSPLGCISADGGDGRYGSDGKCRDGDALVGAFRVLVSPDGRLVYVLARGSNGVARGHYTTLRVALPRALRRAVRAHRRVRATVRLRDRSTPTRVIRRSVVLRAVR